MAIQLPLVEKYRPTNFTDILFDEFLKEKIHTIVQSKQLPNMIITGEPSTGKTSTVLYLAKTIYMDDYDNNVLELNASDDRGLTMIQQTILPFCKKKSDNYKLVILDEADSITQKAQNLLNNIIAEFKKNTRFIFICNQAFHINESIQSRCMILNFPRISRKNIRKKLKEICTKETIGFDEDGLTRLMFCSNYDIRQCINNLECLQYSSNVVSEDTVNNLIDIPKLYNIRKILKYCIEKNLKGAINMSIELLDTGYSVNDILLTFLKYIENNKDYDDNFSIDFIAVYRIISNSYMQVNNGIDNILQLCGCISNVYNLLANSSN